MNKTYEKCPICDHGHLVPIRHAMEFSYKNIRNRIDGFQRSECDHCGAEITDAAQSRTNKRLVMAFHKRVDGVLSGVDIRALRERYGLTQKQAAHIFGGGPIAFSKYENDDVFQSEAMDKLLRLASESEDAMQRLARQAGVDIQPININIGGELFERLKMATNRFLFLEYGLRFEQIQHLQFGFSVNDESFGDEAKRTAA